MKIVDKLLNYKYTKIVLGTLLVVLAAVPLLLANNKSKTPNKKETKVNKAETFAHTEDDIIKEEEYEGLKISNIALITDKGYTTLTANVTGTTDEPTNIEKINIELKDKKGKTVVKFLGNIGKGLKKGEIRKIKAKARGEFKTAVSKTITAYQS